MLDFFDKIIQYSITLAFQGKTLPNHLDAPLVIEGLSPKKEGSYLQPTPSNPWHSTLTRFWSKILHTHRQTPQDRICLLDPKSTHYTSWTHSNIQTFESPDSCLPLLTHTRIPAKRTTPFNIHRVFTPESTSPLFISIHRTPVPSILIQSLVLSLSHESQLQRRFD